MVKVTRDPSVFLYSGDRQGKKRRKGMEKKPDQRRERGAPAHWGKKKKGPGFLASQRGEGKERTRTKMINRSSNGGQSGKHLDRRGSLERKEREGRDQSTHGKQRGPGDQLRRRRVFKREGGGKGGLFSIRHGCTNRDTCGGPQNLRRGPKIIDKTEGDMVKPAKAHVVIEGSKRWGDCAPEDVPKKNRGGSGGFLREGKNCVKKRAQESPTVSGNEGGQNGFRLVDRGVRGGKKRQGPPEVGASNYPM